MVRYISLLLFIGLAFFGCEEEQEETSPTEVTLWGKVYSVENTTEIDLQSDELIGDIPSEIGYLTNLKYLYLAHNQLTGSIPSEIGNLTNLTGLYFDGNQLTGFIPPR